MNRDDGIEPKFSFNFEGASINIYHADQGKGLPKHEHTFSHATVCYAGSIKVTKENNEFIVDKNTRPILLKENEWHEIESLEDGTVFSNIFKTQ